MKYNYQLEALEKLIPAGFKKQRELFFLIREPNIMVLYRRFTAGSTEEYYLAFTHTFFNNVLSKSGKYLLPSLLEYYPVSVATSTLRSQFNLHTIIQDFDCDLHHLKREMHRSTISASKPSFWSWRYLKNLFGKSRTVDSSGSPVDITLAEGLRFLDQFSPAFSYQILLQNQTYNHAVINQQLAECKTYLDNHH